MDAAAADRSHRPTSGHSAFTRARRRRYDPSRKGVIRIRQPFEFKKAWAETGDDKSRPEGTISYDDLVLGRLTKPMYVR